MKHTARIVTALLISTCAAPTFAQQGDGPATLEVVPGTSSYVNVSSRMVNELIVPYTNPKLVKFLRPDTTASVERDGMSIYISTGTEEFIQLIVKDGDVPDQPGISLTLIPVEDVPPQHILLQPSGTAFVGNTGDSDSGLGVADYEDLLRELLRNAAREEVPAGYTKDATWNGTRIQIGAVLGEPLRRLVGNKLAVEYFLLKNTGATRVELSEPNFKSDGVRAIAFINEVLLAPGQTTRMVWVRDR